MNTAVRYIHFGIGAGYCTVAYRIDDNRDSEVRNIEFGMSFCSPRDTFSKGDVFKRVYEPIVRDENGRPLNLGDRKFETVLVHKGGRTQATERLNDANTRQNLQISVKEGDNALATAIFTLQEYAYDHAPGWKSKTKVRSLKNGAVELTRDGYVMTFADPNKDDLVTLRDTERRETYCL